MSRIRGNPLLDWVGELLTLFSGDTIKVPKEYREQVLEVKDTLKNDLSGLANTVLDFSINAALVNYTIETGNSKLTELLNNWTKNINAPLIGKIPRGLSALAKEYFRERWKGSSCLVLKTIWENVDGYKLPTLMYFVNGEDVVIEGKDKDTVQLGEWKYGLRVSPTKTNPLGTGKNEVIFVQKPYEEWTSQYPTPYLIRKGTYKNIKILELASKKGENVLAKAIEYLLMLKKGDKSLANNPEFVYSAEDLTKVKDDFKKIIHDSKTEGGTPNYTTNFDTEIEHIIPEYGRIINNSIYSPIEKRILASLGLVEIVEGVASTRRESILNPKPFVSEVKSGIEDFAQLVSDILYVVEQKNKGAHKKYFNNDIKVRSSAIKEFLTNDAKTLLRGVYDRGCISKETFVELVGDVDFTIEVDRRKQEKKDGLDVTLYPPITQNVEKDVAPDSPSVIIDNEDNENEDKKGVEKEEYNQSVFEESNCPQCAEVFDFESQQEVTLNVVLCPKCGKEVSKEELLKAFYDKKNFPAQIKNLPAGARTIWINTFNKVLKETNNEDQARQAAWRNVKLKYKKVGDKWVKRTKAEIEKSSHKIKVDDLIEIKKLQILGKQESLLDGFLKQGDD